MDKIIRMGSVFLIPYDIRDERESEQQHIEAFCLSRELKPLWDEYEKSLNLNEGYSPTKKELIAFLDKNEVKYNLEDNANLVPDEIFWAMVG